MNFCNQCGHEIKGTAKFCKNCGHQIGETIVKTEHVQPAQIRIQKQRIAFKDRPLKQKIVISALMALGLVLIISYFTLSYLWSANRVMEQFETAVNDGDYEKIAEMIEFEDEDQEIGKENAQVLLRSIIDEDLLEELVTHFNRQADNRVIVPHDVLNLKETNRVLGFKKYEITAIPYYLELRSNLNNTEILHNGISKLTLESNDTYVETGPFVYGEHNFTAIYENDFVNLEENDYVHIGYGWNELDFYFNASTIWIPDNFISEDSEIYLNDQLIDETMIIDYGYSAIGPIDRESNYTLEVKTTFPWGELSTGIVEVNLDAQDSYFYYQLNDDLITELEDALSTYYDKLFAAYEKNDLSELNFLNENLLYSYQDEIDYIHSNADAEELIYYRDLESFGIYDDYLHIFDEEDNLQDIAISVTENATEEFEWYSNDLDEPTYNQVDYIYYLTYQDGQWHVVHRLGDSRSNDAEAKYQSINYGGDPLQIGTIKEDDSDLAENDLIANATVNYIDHMVEAINVGDYSRVEPYIKQGSPLEEMQIGLVDRLVEAGTTQEVIHREVLDIEEDDDQWFVYTDETINIIFESGDEESRDYNWKYTVVQDGDDFKLTNIESD